MKDLTIVVGTIGQGVMRSSDDGKTWERIGPRRGFPYESAVRCLAVNPHRPEIVFAGTEKGLYRSEDAGSHWRLLDSALNPFYIWALAIDPVDPAIMFAGSGTPTPATIFRSTDGGESWQRRPVEVAAECENVGSPRVTAIAVDPQDHRNIWMGLEVDGARRSTDGGDTWTDVDVVHQKDVHNVVVTPGPPKTIFIVANREIYRSTDNGATWKTLGMQQNIPWEYSRSQTYLRGIALQPSRPDTILLGIGDATPGTAGAVARSRDMGQNWEMLRLPVQPNSTIWTFGVNPSDPNIMFAASRYGYLYRSDSAGETWTKLGREFSEIAAVQWLPGEPGSL
jgi:photosystem II stability/assembly factor-like uncharacterized protein